LLLRKEHSFPARADGGEKRVGIEIARLLGHGNRSHDPAITLAPFKSYG
jgi:hypothetical protein